MVNVPIPIMLKKSLKMDTVGTLHIYGRWLQRPGCSSETMLLLKEEPLKLVVSSLGLKKNITEEAYKKQKLVIPFIFITKVHSIFNKSPTPVLRTSTGFNFSQTPMIFNGNSNKISAQLMPK
jgi:hypothetical protein